MLQFFFQDLDAFPDPSDESTGSAVAPISEAETEETIRHLANNKGVGEDQLPGELFKTMLNEQKGFGKLATDAMNEIFVRRRPMPDEWRKTVSILLYKNKGSREDVGNYRPIALIQVVRKIYSSIVHRRLEQFLETNDVLSSAQMGFRRDRGTAHKLVGVYAAVAIAKERKKPLHMICIDFKQAFPSTEHWHPKPPPGALLV